ncbi:4Fe-4S binding protein [Candidatus Woesearchaeota archaeon]|nr:4Fe-4S binding protein [Candidatus Woesearchaeota archaeon]
MLIAIAMFGMFVLHSRYGPNLYLFTFHPIYIFLILLGVAYGVLLAIDWKFLKIPKHVMKKRLWEGIYFIVFLPLVFFPVFKCYFKVPFVFCHVCPRKCIWGYLRPFTVSGVMLMNIQKRLWCYNICPIGILQKKQAEFKKKSFVLPKWIKESIRIIILAALVVSYFVIRKANIEHVFQAQNLYTYMFKNVFSISLSVMIVSGIILLLSFFVYRLWCSYICPIGTCSDLILKLEKRLKVL